MAHPLVSVIIPCFNSEKFVSRSVDSALAQSYPHTEIILIDNASTDNTMEKLLGYQEKHPEKVRVFHESKKGAPAARNKGLAEARGDWVQFLDSDDELLRTKIDVQIELAKKEMAGIVVGAYIVRRPLYSKKIKPVNDPWRGLIASRLGITSSILWRRDLVIAAGSWNDDLSSSQEYDLLFRMLQQNTTVVFDNRYNTLVHFRKESVSQTNMQAKQQKILDNSFGLRYSIQEYLMKSDNYSRELHNELMKYFFWRLIVAKYSCPEFFKKNKETVHLSRLHWLYRCRVSLKERLRHIGHRLIKSI